MARILVGVTGSVAAIKTTQLIEALGGKGYELRMVMTKSADFFLPEWDSVRPSDRVGVFRDSDEWPAKGWKRGDDVVRVSIQKNGTLYVAFGNADADWDGRFEFRVAYGYPAKSYATEAGAKRAIAKYLGGK